MNKKMVLMISAVLLLGILAVSGTISYMVANTDAEHKVCLLYTSINARLYQTIFFELSIFTLLRI